jgi:hypothetical protein
MSMRVVVMMALLAIATACASQDRTTEVARLTSPPPDLTPAARVAAPSPAHINHVVFFKLKDSTNAPLLIQDCDALLAVIPGVVSYYCGTPLDTGRPTVDGHYDVGLYLGFESADDLAAYVEHPNHITIVKAWQPRLEWLRVHDVIDETPQDVSRD